MHKDYDARGETNATTNFDRTARSRAIAANSCRLLPAIAIEVDRCHALQICADGVANGRATERAIMLARDRRL